VSDLTFPLRNKSLMAAKVPVAKRCSRTPEAVVAEGENFGEQALTLARQRLPF
jgi:hypothetical protein